MSGSSASPMRSVVSARALVPHQVTRAAIRTAKRQNLIANPLFPTPVFPYEITPVRPEASAVLNAATSFSSVGENPPSDGTIASAPGSSPVR